MTETVFPFAVESYQQTHFQNGPLCRIVSVCAIKKTIVIFIRIHQTIIMIIKWEKVFRSKYSNPFKMIQFMTINLDKFV